ncbi:hypothetical protein D3C86_1709710 [compost metagenome]
MVIAAVDSVFLKIRKRIMHPAHHPFKIETKPTTADRMGNAGPGCGFLSDRDHIRERLVNGPIEFPQEFYCFQILPAAITVWNPFAFFP